MPRFGVPKPKRFECPEYLSFVRQKTCEFLSYRVGQLPVCFGPVVPHHMKTVGSGGSDLTAVPLCDKHHTKWHQEATFRILWEDRLMRVQRDLLIEFWEQFYINNEATLIAALIKPGKSWKEKP